MLSVTSIPKADNINKQANSKDHKNKGSAKSK